MAKKLVRCFSEHHCATFTDTRVEFNHYNVFKLWDFSKDTIFDFTGLNPYSTNFYLSISAAIVNQLTIRSLVNKISGAVYSEWVSVNPGKCLSGFIWASDIT
ncbi:endonuclease [Cutibacterium acnes]|uniref:endonuclease n=1 Tax=Cutibacterium acnes TaxID=1747 RepID=UPI0021B62810|nr:endonuclease [Cutibacterium acnes]WGH46735.1 endonuclease [Cutibacterium acnes]